MAQIELNRRPNFAQHRWLLIPALAIVLLIALAYASKTAWNGQAYNGESRVPVASIAREGRVWVPQGPAMLWPDDQMVSIGHTKEGEALYTRTALVGGGGGSVGPAAPARAYLKVANGQYQPMALVSVVP